jgi:hypothetical protein
MMRGVLWWGEDINRESMLIYGFLDFGRGLVRIPWRGMDESMYASFLWICPRFAWTPHPVGGSPVSKALHMYIFHQPLESRFF